MVNDTKIFCYAEYDNKRGIVKDKTIYLVKIQRFSILKITTTMYSIDNITLACYTNSSSTAITYKWYFNGNVVTTGNKIMMKNNQSVGFITFSNLRHRDIGLVACEAYYKTLKIDQHRIRLNVSEIPTATLTSSTVANINAKVAYSCVSSVKSARVYVTYQNSDKTKNFNRMSDYTGKFSIKSDTNISCYSQENFLKGPVKKTTVFVSKGKQLCTAETKEDLVWPQTLVEKKTEVSCPDGFEGSATRQCKKDGQWNAPDLSECVRTVIKDALADLNKVTAGLTKDPFIPVKDLAAATNTTLKKKELTISIEAIDEIVEITEDMTEINDGYINNFFEISSNLLKEENEVAWAAINEDKVEGVVNTPQNMMKNIEKFGAIVSAKINESLVIAKENLFVEIKKASVEENMIVPSKSKTTLPLWIQNSLTKVNISAESLKEIFRVNQSASVVTTIFKSISDILPGVSIKDLDLNSYVLSIKFGQSYVTNLKNPIHMTFQHRILNYSNPVCSFWDFNLINTTGGGWSSEGCYLDSTNLIVSQCKCNHLTNFAILMNPWIDVEKSYDLRLMTIVGCWISVVALVMTILVYATCWKKVASRDVANSRSVLLMNLCVSLIAVYLIFMFGIERTQNTSECKAVSILLLYFLLAAFFCMLAEGIDISIALTVVFTSDFQRLPWLVALCWVAPAVIVAICLGVTRLEGFSNDQFCWISRENGLIWAFIGPVIAIIVANTVCAIFVLRALMSSSRMLIETTKDRVRKGARAIIILSPLLGFTWIIGLFSVNEDTIVFQYIFTVLTALQGFFIFLIYCLFNEQLRKAFSEKRLQYLSTKQQTLYDKNTKESRTDSITNDIKLSASDRNYDYGQSVYSNNIRNSNISTGKRSALDISGK